MHTPSQVAGQAAGVPSAHLYWSTPQLPQTAATPFNTATTWQPPSSFGLFLADFLGKFITLKLHTYTYIRITDGSYILNNDTTQTIATQPLSMW